MLNGCDTKNLEYHPIIRRLNYDFLVVYKPFSGYVERVRINCCLNILI